MPTETAASRGAIPRACSAALRSRDCSCSFSARGLPRRSRTVLPRDPRFDEIRDASPLFVAPVDRAIEVLRDHLYLSRILYRSEEHTSELQSLRHLVCRLLLEKKNK